MWPQRFLCVSILAVLAAPTLRAETSGAEPEQFYLQGRRLERDGQVTPALAAYTRAAELAVDEIRLALRSGGVAVAAVAEGTSDSAGRGVAVSSPAARKALRSLGQVEQLSRAAEAYRARGRLLLRQGRLAAGEEDLRTANLFELDALCARIGEPGPGTPQVVPQDPPQLTKKRRCPT